MLLTLYFLMGLNVGSFLNVLVYRLPKSISLHNPRYSQCPSCTYRIASRDLIPILSYFLLKGHCRHCQQKISLKYPLIEVLCALLWLLIAWKFLYITWEPSKAILGALFISILVAELFIDLEHTILPDQLNTALVLLGFTYHALSGEILQSLIGSWICCGILWLIAIAGRILFKKDAMGHGDLKMIRGIGAILLPAGTLISLIAAIFIATMSIPLIALFSKNKQTPAIIPETESPEPENIGSLLRSGIGYILFLDILLRPLPKLRTSWFDEEPLEPLSQELPLPSNVIPFGPFLAIGATLVFLWREAFEHLIDLYLTWAGLKG
jgi:leader peptidase (prepilin peptidase)/N-methyltransferase